MDDPKEIDVHQSSPFVPQSIKDRATGPRRSIALLIHQVDTKDPAFPFVAKALQDMAAAGVELDATAIGIAAKLGRKAHEEETRKRHAKPERLSIVYYVRRGDLVKIGTTSNPVARFISLMPDEIMAHEPGGHDLEMTRHRQFAADRVAKKGEYFRQSQRLLAHIAAVRELHGAPDISWSSVASLGTGYRRTKMPVELPEPTTGELATATEGAKLLGINKSTVQGWVHRKLITPAGRNDKGRPVYFVEHMRFLIDRNREWMNRRRPTAS
ncbi:hypothetical protein HW130_03085 [Streptomyces sp. PKU-EA00015]|uniref:hypothetical protein n=1 Tax=Streptomyces sp. PKU-EA00015 TaxID=2748326 RepID=UPI0015A1DB74|nr:hypothetical protein [Streptomyces sp. PKU-EA00015]NWF25256.1 hypothetical protein [Streptomyces sp. PKU-EA00015]